MYLCRSTRIVQKAVFIVLPHKCDPKHCSQAGFGEGQVETRKLTKGNTLGRLSSELRWIKILFPVLFLLNKTF